MSKKPKEKCKHGNSPVYMQGCATCVINAMTALNILNDNNITADHLWVMLHAAFPTKELWANAVADAQVKINEQERKTNP